MNLLSQIISLTLRENSSNEIVARRGCFLEDLRLNRRTSFTASSAFLRNDSCELEPTYGYGTDRTNSHNELPTGFQ